MKLWLRNGHLCARNQFCRTKPWKHRNKTKTKKKKKSRGNANEALTRKNICEAKHYNSFQAWNSLSTRYENLQQKNQFEKIYFLFFFLSVWIRCETYATEAIFTIDDRQLMSVPNKNGYGTDNVQTENAVTFVAGSVDTAATRDCCVWTQAGAAHATVCKWESVESSRNTHSRVCMCVFVCRDQRVDGKNVRWLPLAREVVRSSLRSCSTQNTLVYIIIRNYDIHFCCCCLRPCIFVCIRRTTQDSRQQPSTHMHIMRRIPMQMHVGDRRMREGRGSEGR